MTIQHADLPDSQLHEPKGVVAASEGDVYVANGSGSGVWKAPEIAGQAASTSGQVPVSTGGGVNWVDAYSNMSVSRLIDGESAAVAQNPSGLGIPLQIEFGPAIDAGEVVLSATGALTFVDGGTYRVKVNTQLGRTGGSGTSELYLRALVNGVQAGRSVAFKLDDSNVLLNFVDEAWLTLPSGTVVTYEIVRDTTGNNSGGALQATPAVSGWNASPSAAIRVEKFV